MDLPRERYSLTASILLSLIEFDILVILFVFLGRRFGGVRRLGDPVSEID